MEDYLEEIKYLGYAGVSYELYLTPQEINELSIPDEEEIQEFQQQNRNITEEEMER